MLGMLKSQRDPKTFCQALQIICHAEDPGSIPGSGFCFVYVRTPLPPTRTHENFNHVARPCSLAWCPRMSGCHRERLRWKRVRTSCKIDGPTPFTFPPHARVVTCQISYMSAIVLALASLPCSCAARDKVFLIFSFEQVDPREIHS